MKLITGLLACLACAVALLLPGISSADAGPTPITAPKIETFAVNSRSFAVTQVTPPPAVSPWSGALFLDFVHKDADVIALRDITVQHDILGARGLNFEVKGFGGYAVRSGSVVLGGSIGISKTISREGSSVYGGLGATAPFDKKKLDFGLGITLGLQVKIPGF